MRVRVGIIYANVGSRIEYRCKCLLCLIRPSQDETDISVNSGQKTGSINYVRW